MLNSLILAGVSSVVRVITASMAAFALSFFEFRGRNVIFMLIMGTMMVPSDIVLVSNYHTVSRLGWINTYMGMMIVFFVSANNIFMMRQYYLTFSKDLKEASEVDGCGNIRFFCTILLPLSTPIITTIFISSFISTWNTYLWPMLVTNDNLMRTVQVGVTMLNFPEGSTYGPVMAASMIVLLPNAGGVRHLPAADCRRHHGRGGEGVRGSLHLWLSARRGFASAEATRGLSARPLDPFGTATFGVSCGLCESAA